MRLKGKSFAFFLLIKTNAVHILQLPHAIFFLKHEPHFFCVVLCLNKLNFWYLQSLIRWNKKEIYAVHHRSRRSKRKSRPQNEYIHFDTLNVSVCEGSINIEYAQYIEWVFVQIEPNDFHWMYVKIRAETETEAATANRKRTKTQREREKRKADEVCLWICFVFHMIYTYRFSWIHALKYLWNVLY